MIDDDEGYDYNTHIYSWSLISRERETKKKYHIKEIQVGIVFACVLFCVY